MKSRGDANSTFDLQLFLQLGNRSQKRVVVRPHHEIDVDRALAPSHEHGGCPTHEIDADRRTYRATEGLHEALNALAFSGRRMPRTRGLRRALEAHQAPDERIVATMS